MTKDEQRVVELIRKAFQGVKLGNGVGLMQAQGLDDYEDPKTIADYRAKDEKEDWSRIPASELNYCYSSLSFFDAEGMRFHLPAFLIADIEGTFNQDVIFHLTCFAHDAKSRFVKLNELQRNAVREFLLLRFCDQDRKFERPMIEKALTEYWTKSEEK